MKKLFVFSLLLVLLCSLYVVVNAENLDAAVALVRELLRAA